MRNLPEKFSNRIRVSDDGCWLWPRLNNRGYGLVYWKGSTRATHVVIYEVLVGLVPAGLELDHLCRVPACCNPGHLEPVTHAENQRRAAAAHTHCRRGHERTPENTYWPPDGRRRCRPCMRDTDRARQHRRNRSAA